MSTLVFDLKYPEKFLFENVKVGKPETYGDTQSYPLMYYNTSTNTEGIISIDFHPFIFMFGKTRAPFGVNTKAHLVDLTLGSKDNYEENPMYEFLSKWDGCLQDIVDTKLTGVDFEPTIQYSKKKVDGELVENRDHGPHYTIGLHKRPNRSDGTFKYLFNVQGESGRLHEVFDAEGMISPGALIQPACFMHSISVTKDVARCRPKLQAVKICDNIEINFDDDVRVFEEL